MNIAALLPKTESWALRLTVAGVSTAFVLLGLQALTFFAAKFSLSASGDLILAAICLATGIPLWRLSARARKFALFCLGLLAIAVPVAMGSPGFYDDFLRHKAEIPWLRMALVVTTVEVPIFWVFYIFGKYKNAFT